jgi:hypothetical protein
MQCACAKLSSVACPAQQRKSDYYRILTILPQQLRRMCELMLLTYNHQERGITNNHPRLHNPITTGVCTIPATLHTHFHGISDNLFR